MLIFVEGRKHENLEKNPWSKARTNNKLTPHIGHAGCNQTWATFVVGQCSHLHCAIPAPPKGYGKCSLYELAYETPNILINYNYLDRKHISISWVWCGSYMEMLVFVEGGKPGEPRKKPWEQGREPTTNSTHIFHTAVSSLLPYLWPSTIQCANSRHLEAL